MENIVTEIQEAKAVNLREKAAAYFELTKPRIAFMLVLTAAAGFYLGSNGTFDWRLFINSMVGITLLAFGVATLNQYIERNIDGLMERTAKRPLPAGKLSGAEALAFGILLAAVAEIYLLVLVNPLTAILGPSESVEDPAERLTAVSTLLAEETRVAMMIGVTVGWALAEELPDPDPTPPNAAE